MKKPADGDDVPPATMRLAPGSALPTLGYPEAQDEVEVTETKQIGPLSNDEPVARDRPYLIMVAGSGVGQMHLITGPRLIIGRSAKAHVQIDDESVSRLHAEIIKEEGDVYVQDLDSANGTRLNGVVIEGRATLADGDKIRVGSTSILKFTYSDRHDESFQRQMYDAALRDRLTNTFNKAYLLERLDNEFAYAKRHGEALALVMIDADHFKRINDTHGHLAGDHALTELARVMQVGLRTEDVLARYGGEEFCIICRGIPIAGAFLVAERLRRTVEAEHVIFEQAKLRLTVSVGVASYPENQVDGATALIAAADAALLSAKRAGRNRVVAGTSS